MNLDRLPGPLREAVRARLATLEQNGVPARLWARDPGLWSEEAAHQEVARNRLGWLDVATDMRRAVPELGAFAAGLAKEGFTHAVLLGMGGSSLAPEVLRLSFGVAPGALDLSVLDSTSPAAVRGCLAAHDPARTFVLVSSKSGGTIEVVSLEACFQEWIAESRGADAGWAFAAITDPGTSLERLAAKRRYRHVFTNPPDIGGRYSALSLFGLVPAALIGADVPGLLEAAEAERRRSQPSVPAAQNPGLALGAALGELALRGRDKLTLVLGPEIASFGNWVEQLVAESTGKDGRGIVPVAGEPLAGPDAYGMDRTFVAVSVNPLPAEVAGRLEELEAAGHPVLRWTLDALGSLGGEFLRWEIATAVASSVLGVDAFDEPNVTEAKQATQAALETAVHEGHAPSRAPLAARGAIRAEAPATIAERLRASVANGGDPVAWAAALPTLAGAGDYVALLAYLRHTPERDARLQRLRVAIRAATRAATTSGYGPRFLHSTGQLHKGGPNTGVFLQLTADEGEDVAIPGSPYGFATLIAAQAWGDFEVLERRERRVLRLHLGNTPERTLDELIEALQAARV